ncbi:hypothetical protein LTR99_006734 [Exophiala xenobiotica]|uniref:Uncharacterized protein n=1 Tax=Vermiconidia calcicola TaxID=1690605 RepID=A0AAV9Q045_9PEZI|nr:hypothetical protein H2202_001555 [Exophiala xenobiotica]KAK5531731.1 hypothetical protein LTR25_008061 [Vermiconidia calcicola]KAK5542801.1 hypothetical protein LTR23_005411 [Chaetothyriales sp. CCFEE 6169]KAK5193183.1 hypothetical protein LTR92_006552 [Exophiala xenobiotica]KAK5204784.1 hypothetical protein LTR41_009640 [Exophiala xenobiotica]
MYPSLILPWSPDPSGAEGQYRTAGLVKTKGTLFLVPPPNDVLRETFNAPPRPKTRMSSGAVALCKHFERGGASSEHGRHHPFWTLPTGSNEDKTNIASRILEDILAHAIWKNVMLLHHGVAVYEMRNGLGYGMRWTLDLEVKFPSEETDEKKDDLDKEWTVVRTTFRGCLEPIADLDHELPLPSQEKSHDKEDPVLETI